MSEQQPEPTYDLQSAKLALEEMRFAMEKKWQASDSLVSNGHLLLAAAGVALALAGTLPTAPADTLLGGIYWLGLAAAFVVYLLMLGTVLTATQPDTYNLAIRADWQTLKDGIMQRDERDALLQLVRNYAHYLQANEKINQNKAAHIRKAMRLLVVIVFLLLFTRAVAGLG